VETSHRVLAVHADFSDESFIVVLEISQQDLLNGATHVIVGGA